MGGGPPSRGANARHKMMPVTGSDSDAGASCVFGNQGACAARL